MEPEDIGELFSTFDVGSKGYLYIDEFSHLCSELHLDQSQIKEVFDLLDVNKDGKLEKSEFLNRFVALADGFFDSKPTDQEEYSSNINRSSTPNQEVSTMPSQTTWDNILDQFGHVMFVLTSYESIDGFYKLIKGDSLLQSNFQKLLVGIVKDVERLWNAISDLEASLERVTKQKEEQLIHLEEEMETQIRSREKLIRKSEQEKFDMESEKQKQNYEQQIMKLQEAVQNLKKVDDRLSGISPYSKEMESLREKLREVTAENATLRTRLNEAETNMTVLQSEISTLQLELHEKSLEYERESDAVTMALSEQESMSRQVNSLYTDNRRLRDSNVDLRNALESNSAVIRRISTRLSKSQSSSTLGGLSTLSLYPSGRVGSSRGASPVPSYLDVQALAECDPGLRVTSYSGDDETEIDISLKSSLDDAAYRKNNTFERDSGVGTLKTECDSDTEVDFQQRLKGVVGPPYSYAPFPPSQPYRKSIRKNRNQSKKNDLPLDDFTDRDSSNEDFPGETRSKNSKRRKVIIDPGMIAAKDQMYKVILCGDANVGKSSIILRFCQDEFKLRTRSTLGLDFRVKNISLSESEAVTVQLWDTAGQEKFRSISTSYFRKADGVVLVYDVTCPSSFINVRDWMEKITETVPEDTPVLICGNKVDLRTNAAGEVVYPTEGAQLAANYGVLFMETSASSGMNINNGMRLLARHLVNSSKDREKDETITELKRKLEKTSCC